MPERREWTMGLLHRLHKRRMEGEPTIELAQEVDTSPGNLIRAWKRAGLSPMAARKADQKRRARFLQDAYYLRKRGQTWEKVAKQIGWPREPETLRVALKRWATRARIPYEPLGFTDQSKAQQIRTRARNRRAPQEESNMT